MGGIGKLLGLTLNPNIQPIEGAGRVQRTQQPTFTGAEAGVAGINGELTPKLSAGDDYYTNNPDPAKRHGLTSMMYMA